ncbi:MAG: hypothetical protein ABI475_01505 [Methylophilaceae bacterium]
MSRVIAVEQSSVANAINDALDALQCQLPGIQALALDKLTCKLTLAYDTAVVSFSAILAQLMQAGIYPVDTRWFRLKSAWYDYTDQNAAEQAHAKPKGCCNRAPGV